MAVMPMTVAPGSTAVLAGLEPSVLRVFPGKTAKLTEACGLATAVAAGLAGAAVLAAMVETAAMVATAAAAREVP